MKELALLFAKLGTIAFGGPAAHIAMMEDEVVRRRQWLTHDHFLDLVGAVNLIPGPNSTELALHIGFLRAGWKGLLLAGACFIVPAVAITLLFARLYVAYGSLPQMQPFVTGIRPAIVAVVIAAVIRLGRPALRNRFTFGCGVAVVVLNILGVDEILLLFSAGAIGLLWTFRSTLYRQTSAFLAIPLAWMASAPGAGPAADLTVAGLGLFFLKIGSILYGSGYVLMSFLQGGLVDTRHWLTQSQLIDAVAVGQFTPGPLSSTATFIGYVLLGLPGAGVATLGMFAPSFVFVAATIPFILRMRRSPLARGFLDGVNAASLGLMLAVTIKLSAIALHAPGAIALFVLSAASLFLWNLNAAWIVLGSSVLGWIFSLFS